MTPNDNSQRPSRIASAGMMVFIGRLAGPMAFGWEGSTTKQEPRLCSMIPVFSVAMPQPNWL